MVLLDYASWIFCTLWEDDPVNYFLSPNSELGSIALMKNEAWGRPSLREMIPFMKSIFFASQLICVLKKHKAVLHASISNL